MEPWPGACSGQGRVLVSPTQTGITAWRPRSNGMDEERMKSPGTISGTR